MAFLPLGHSPARPQHGHMTTTLPELPDTPLARATLDLVTEQESASIANHSIRSYLFGVLLADHRGVEVDRQLLFLSCVLHDIGLSNRGNRGQRFEVDGADVAAEFLTEQGLPRTDVDVVWEAIALHTSPGIAERRGPVVEFTRRGVGVDFGRDADIVTGDQAEAIHSAYPGWRWRRRLRTQLLLRHRSTRTRRPGTPSRASCCESAHRAHPPCSRSEPRPLAGAADQWTGFQPRRMRLLCRQAP